MGRRWRVGWQGKLVLAEVDAVGMVPDGSLIDEIIRGGTRRMVAAALVKV